MDMRKRERKGLLPLPPTRTKTSIAFTEITIKVKQGQKQLKKLIYFNEQRYFVRRIGNIFYRFNKFGLIHTRGR